MDSNRHVLSVNAVTEDFTAFSSGCARWNRPAAAAPAVLVASARVAEPRAAAGVIVFQRGRGDTAGRNPHRLHDEPHQFALGWSPDGRRVAWVGADGRGGIRRDAANRR